GFGMAVEKAYGDIDQSLERIKALRTHLIDRLRAEGVEYKTNGDLDRSLPYIISLGFPGVRGEVLVHFLESQNVFISTGSACHSRTVKISHVLKSIGVSRPQAEGTIRISFSVLNNEEDVEILAAGLKSALSRLKPAAS
ncbi:MAG: aminotransferase class V-fold PLP-dependent enzyme, partial [Candidatus Saccharibacteria bacterium]